MATTPMARTAGVSARIAQALIAQALIAAALLAACDDDSPRPGAPERPGIVPPIQSAAPAPSSAAPTTATAAQPAPSAGAEAGVLSMIGTWQGTYDAKKASIELPPAVKDKGRTKDDGATATGPGNMTLSIEPDGSLRGQAKGALGDATLSGEAEGDMIRASVIPDDPHAPHAMRGMLVGMLKDSVIRAELRVTGPDAMLIRESVVELRRK